MVSNLPRLEASLRSNKRDDSTSPHSRLEPRLEARLERSKRQSSNLSLARSTNALDVFSAESPRGPVQHIRIRQSVSRRLSAAATAAAAVVVVPCRAEGSPLQ